MRNNNILKMQDMLMEQMERLTNDEIMKEDSYKEINRSVALSGSASVYLKAISLNMKIIDTAEKHSINVEDMNNYLGISNKELALKDEKESI